MHEDPSPRFHLWLNRLSANALTTNIKLADPERIGHPSERRDEILEGLFDKADAFIQVRRV